MFSWLDKSSVLQNNCHAGKSDGISCWGLKEHNFIVFEKMALSLIDALS